jgi:uncharacterized repeat protein (TIGR03803 family)
MIIKFTSLLRNSGRTLLLAGIFSAASAFANPQVATPNFSPASGVYSSAQSVTITSATSGASIAYTTDGSIPTVSAGTVTHGALYSGPITVSGNTILSAIAFENGYADSAVAIDGYTLQAAVSSLGGTSPATTFQSATTQAAAPTFGLPAGTYASAQSTTVSTTTSGATIIYTTDGSTPTESNGTPTGTGIPLSNGGSVSVNATMILKAIAYATGFTDSPVVSNIYTITSWPRVIVNVIHDFVGISNLGEYPIGGLVQGTDGNFYGTTAGLLDAASSTGSGSNVFKVTSAGAFTSLVSFSGFNGIQPTAGLVQGTDGNFYGTTFYGGSTFNGVSALGDGTVFKMTPAGTLTPLVSFTGANGSNPTAALVQGTDGNFYGTTPLGGGNQLGAIFKVTPTGSLATLVSFNGSNGSAPSCALVLGTDGNFYGTTDLGGSTFVSTSNGGDGTVFKMTPAGSLTTLVSFTGPNGANPIAGLVQGTDGNFYGTTGEDGSINDGTVFKMTPTGGLTTLATFTGVNGDQPSAGLVQGTDGNFYGATELGGAGAGTIFRTSATGGLTTLFPFDNANGNDPSGSLIQGSDGNFYGTTIEGGALNFGTIFQLIVPSGVTGAVVPAFSLATGTYTSAQTVTITTATSGASIVYTTNGSPPSERGGMVTNGTLYLGPVSIGATTTLEAIAFKNGMFDSAATSGSYTINIPAPTPAPAASGSGGGAPSYWFLGFLAFAGLLRWRLRKIQALT